jgi:aminopeptidase N
MGDSLFSVGCKGYMNNRAYDNATSAQFRDELTSASGIDMTRFFDDWIFTPGFPQFSIDSVVHVSAALDHYWVYTRQKTKGNVAHLYSMPVDITFSNGIQNDTTVSVLIDSVTNVFHVALIGVFDFIALDRNEKVSDAISDYERSITAAGSIAFPETNVILIVQSVGTSSPFVRIEHNWVKPDDFILPNPGIRLSDYHYWKVDGRFDSTFISAANFTYDGRTPAVSSSINSGYIDNTLISSTEDSLVLLYRRKAGENWMVIPNTTTNFVGSHTDKSGNIRVDTLRKGEYVLGYRDYTVTSFPEVTSPENHLALKAFPNPAENICRLEFAVPYGETGTVSVFDSSGKMVYRTAVFSHQPFINWDTYGYAAGQYTATLQVKGSKVSEKIILIKR